MKLQKKNYELKVIHNNEIRIQPTESTYYSSIIKLLRQKETKYYTYKPKELRGFKVVLRNMHHSADQADIKQELEELGHKVMNIHNMQQRGTNKPLPLFTIELESKENNKTIYDIDQLLNCKISFEASHHKRTIPQCSNCQMYGHTKNYCTRDSVCVKCAGKHKTLDCRLLKEHDTPKCA